MILTSPAFANGQAMAATFSKEAGNVSPPLEWHDAPLGTHSYALIIVDHHPVAHDFVHWMLADIPPTATALAQGASAAGLPPNAKELHMYFGPLPPVGSGVHTYECTLFALDVPACGLPPNATLDAFLQATAPHTLATAQLSGTYIRA